MYKIPFESREDAGKQLAQKLEAYKTCKNGLVVALPRGGVVCAYYIAKALNWPLDIVCPRKLAAPDNPEYALGVVTEEGTIISTLAHPTVDLEAIAEKERLIAQKRLKEYRQGLPRRDFAGKTVILVDDGLATGSTMLGALKSVEEAEKVVIAVPVASKESLALFKEYEIVCLEQPKIFYAVGQFYKSFEQVPDECVKTLLKETARLL